MHFNPFSMVVMIVAISTIGWLVNNWIRAKHGYPLESEWGGMDDMDDMDDMGGGHHVKNKRKVELLTQENEKLTGKISHLEERIAVLERIATDKHSSSSRLSEEIERLRN